MPRLIRRIPSRRNTIRITVLRVMCVASSSKLKMKNSFFLFSFHRKQHKYSKICHIHKIAFCCCHARHRYLHLRDVSDMFGSEDEVLLYRENRTKRESGRRRQTHQLQIHRGMPVWRANEPLEVTLGALSLVNVGTRTPTYGVIVAENNGILPQQIPEDWTPFRLTDMSKTLAELTKDSADSHQLSLMVEHVKARRSKGLPWSNQVWMKDMKVWDLVEVRVGRNSWCEVQILSMESSGKHAEFYVCPVGSSGDCSRKDCFWASTLYGRVSPLGSNNTTPLPYLECFCRASSSLSSGYRRCDCESHNRRIQEKTVHRYRIMASATSIPRSSIAYAKCALGLASAHGIGGVRRDEKAAVQLYTEAAVLGQPRAEYLLARCYEAGFVVSKDCSQALQWFQKAARNGRACEATKRSAMRSLSQRYVDFQKVSCTTSNCIAFLSL
mmetsp:Transcript_33752/g.57212  ORF Transcript_33752/g.57212 Transcript_33752/m.57212 type:complete len:440 (+) Transcript_33752:338-1657(+)